MVSNPCDSGEWWFTKSSGYQTGQIVGRPVLISPIGSNAKEAPTKAFNRYLPNFEPGHLKRLFEAPRRVRVDTIPVDSLSKHDCEQRTCALKYGLFPAGSVRIIPSGPGNRECCRVPLVCGSSASIKRGRANEST